MAARVATDDVVFGEKVRMLRNYGQRRRYHHEIIGINSRLDELQAAILSTKLPHLDEWNRRRRRIAVQYTRVGRFTGASSRAGV